MAARRVRSGRRALLVMAIVAGLARAVGAEDLAREGDALTREAARIDESARRVDDAHVQDVLVYEFSDFRVKLSDWDPGRPLVSLDVRTLRDQHLGYGDVAIVLALYGNQPGTPFYTVEQVAALTRAGGWTSVARAMGYKSLGAVVRDVKRTGKSVDALARTAKNDKSGR